MSAQSIIQQVRWQDLIVRSEVDVVFEIARKEGWKDCGTFGYGDMITQSQESTGWKLIPADLYEGSIPAEGIVRVHQIINAGVRIQGVIIADDERRIETQPTLAKSKILLTSVTKILAFIGRALAGVGRLLAGLGGALIRLISIVGAIALMSLFAYILISSVPTIFILGLVGIIVMGILGSTTSFDPKLVILVDDGQGGTVWVSVLTWYD